MTKSDAVLNRPEEKPTVLSHRVTVGVFVHGQHELLDDKVKEMVWNYLNSLLDPVNSTDDISFDCDGPMSIQKFSRD